MSENALLSRMLRYQAWANDEMLTAIAGLDAVEHADERHLALRLMNHCLVVNRIFAAHLTGERHGFASDNTPDTPEPDALRAAFAALDRWYLDHVEAATPAMLMSGSALGPILGGTLAQSFGFAALGYAGVLIAMISTGFFIAGCAPRKTERTYA